MGDTPAAQVLPMYNIDLVRTVRYFVVENLRSARRFLKACDKSINIDELHFVELSEHTPTEAVAANARADEARLRHLELSAKPVARQLPTRVPI